MQKLTRKDADWIWTDQCNKAVDKVKDTISRATTLKYYNPKECTLQCDASSTGPGAELMQQGEPVAYASRA